MTAYNTKGLTEAQIEPVARLVMAGDRLYWLIPFLIGFWLNAMLFGVLVVLFVRWQGTVARTDKVWVKGIVYYLFILHCGATVYSMLYSEYMFVAGFGRYRNLINPSWARPSWVLGACSRIPCSAFFTHRAWVMYRRHWSVPVCVVPMFLGSAACAFAAVGTFEYMPLPVITRQLFMGMPNRVRAYQSAHRTDIVTLIETQSPPTIVAALQFIVTAKWGDTSQVAYFHAAPRLYPICLLMILNSRNTYIHMTQRNVYMPHSGESASQSEDLTMRSKEGGIMVDRVTHVTVQDWAPYPFVRRSVNRDNLSLPPDSSLSEDGGEDAKEVDVKVDETV